MISEAANLILPFHREMDEIREDAAGKSKIELLEALDLLMRIKSEDAQ